MGTHDLLTPTQAAKKLSVTPGTLSAWRYNRRYPLSYLKIGSRVFYTAADIAEFIKLRTVPGTRSAHSKRRRSSKSRLS